MTKIVSFLIISLIPLVLWAMKPISDSDLSNVNSPASLNVYPGQINEMNNNNNSRSYAEDLNYDDLKIRFDLHLFEDVNDNTPNIFSHFLYISTKNDQSNQNVKIFLIDPITLQDETSLILAEDSFDSYKLRYIQPDITHSISYPLGNTSSSNTPYEYTIRSGNIDMRNTYINNTNTSIMPRSWVDIKTR
jgi:hypothetical protein